MPRAQVYHLPTLTRLTSSVFVPGNAAITWLPLPPAELPPVVHVDVETPSESSTPAEEYKEPDEHFVHGSAALNLSTLVPLLRT